MARDVKERTATITFKVAQELFDEIQAWGNKQRDEAGLPLTVHIAARRLMNEAIRVSSDFRAGKPKNPPAKK